MLAFPHQLPLLLITRYSHMTHLSSTLSQSHSLPNVIGIKIPKLKFQIPIP